MSDKLNTSPLYKQVQERLIERIETGDWRPGDALPNEFKLAEILGVSQGTVRKAMRQLEHDGLLERRQGRGTFVATSTEERALFHFFRLRQGDGQALIPQSRLVRARLVPANEEQWVNFSWLEQKEGSKREHSDEVRHRQLVELHRLRFFEDKPCASELIHLPSLLFPGLEDEKSLPEALYPFFQSQYGQSVFTADEKLRAVGLPPQEANLLEQAYGTPALVVTRQSYTYRRQCLELRKTYYLCQDFHYQVHLS